MFDNYSGCLATVTCGRTGFCSLGVVNGNNCVGDLAHGDVVLILYAVTDNWGSDCKFVVLSADNRGWLYSDELNIILKREE